MKIIAIIPARGGSKRIPRKNIKLLCGKPLISYAIAAAKESKYINRIIVSTEDQEIAKIAKRCKAEVPFIRPVELAQDDSTSLTVLQHAVKYLETNEGYIPDLIILIQSTSPFVLTSDIDRAVEKIVETKSNSCVSICEISERPEWMFTLDEVDKIKPFLKKKNNVIIRKKLEKLFRLNGAVYVVKRDTLMKNDNIIDVKSCAGVIMPPERSIDIDKPVDFLISEVIMKHSLSLSNINLNNYD